jgi:ankyrin repeat protein
MVKLLLAHGANPNSEVDSSGNAVSAASTPEIRALLEAHGGTIDPYDTSWIAGDAGAMRRLADDPRAAFRVGAAFTMVCGSSRRDLLDRLLAAGFRIPSVVTGCQGYLLHDTEMLRVLLAHGMSPDLMNWQHQTLLHFACESGNVECAAILLDAGANISARDDEYRSTPLAWAARTNAAPMVEFLLARGARTNLPDDEPWATPLAWAERRQHARIAALLRRHGANS